MPDFSSASYLLGSNSLVVRIPDFDETANDNVLAAAATSISFIRIDNSANAAATSYAKLYNATSATVGTTAPNLIIPVSGGSTVIVAVVGEVLAFATGVSAACVTTAGTAGTTGPTSVVVGTIVAAT